MSLKTILRHLFIQNYDEGLNLFLGRKAPKKFGAEKENFSAPNASSKPQNNPIWGANAPNGNIVRYQ